ncbi:NUDIX hydrolase-like domain superfamily, partial [Arabidopsis thaliana x Arabidopsis arenosa]
MKARNPYSDRSSNGEDETIKNGEDDWNKWSCDGHMRKMPKKKEKLRGGAGHISAGDPSLLSAQRELQEELGVKLPNDALKRYSFFCRNGLFLGLYQSNPIRKDGKQVNAARYAYLIREQRKMLLLSYNFQAYLQLLQQSQSSSPTQRNSTLRILRSLKERIKRLDKSKRKRRTKWMSKGRCEQGKEKEKEGR